MTVEAEKQVQASVEGVPAAQLHTRRWLVKTDAPPRACILFLHGFVEHVGRYESKFPLLAERGFQITAYDQRGFGQTNLKSEDPAGSYSKSTSAQRLADLDLVIQEERKRLDADHGEDTVPLYLGGQCQGGSLALAYLTQPETKDVPSAKERSRVSGVILTSPWLKLTKPPPFFVAPMAGLASRWYPLLKMSAGMPGKDLTSDADAQQSIDADPLCAQDVYLSTITELMNEGNALAKNVPGRWPRSLPILAIHGDADDITSCDATATLVDQLDAEDKTFQKVSSGRHKLWDEPDASEMIDQIADWLSVRVPQSSTGGTTDTNVSETPPAPSGILSKPASACWATLLTHDKLLPGLVVFATSLLKDHKSRYPLVVMATDTLSEKARVVVEALGCQIRDIERIDPVQEPINMTYARFREAWSKIRAFELVEFERVVLLDSDMLVLKNMDDLMEHPLAAGSIAASFACTCNPRKIASYPEDWTPDNCPFTPQRHPSCLKSLPSVNSDSPRTYHLLNSGLVVLTPSLSVMESMITRVQTDPVVPTYALPDQDFLADYFHGHFQPLPYTYNALKTLKDCHASMWRDEEVHNVHYILDKPWESGPPSEKALDNISSIHRWWWAAWRRAERDKGSLGDHSWEMVKAFVNDVQVP